MATTYTININLDPNTVTTLLANKFKLYAFKGVDGPPTGVPVVWFTTNAFSTTNALSWQEQYGGYTSTTTNLAAGTQITASFSAAMNLGQLMTVNNGGIGTVSNNGQAGSIEILNATNNLYTCGISVQNSVTNTQTPICAFPLFSQGLDNFAPVQQVFLMFATTPINTGTVIEQSFAPGILVDMTGQTSPVSVSYNITGGWSGPGNTTNYPANASLVPLLINPGSAQAVSARAAQRALAR